MWLMVPHYVGASCSELIDMKLLGSSLEGEHMNRRRSSLQTVAAVLSSVVLVLLGASAAQGLPALDSDGSVTVHRLQNIPVGESNSGLEDRTIDFAKHPPLSGITFTIQKIEGVDFSVTDGWKALEPKTAAFTPGDPTNGYGLGSLGGETSFVTAASGLAVFANLSVGAYLVRETAGATSAPHTAIPTEPFIVTIPMSHPVDSEAWSYDVHVYPGSVAANAAAIVPADSDVALGVEKVGQNSGFVLPFMGDGGTILITGVAMLLALVSMVAFARGRVVANNQL